MGSSSRYVCIHGHFYQPPRVNPWLEVVLREETASPYHDWNERIYYECYRANAASRLVDPENRVLRLHNNYEWMSFNIGPTLINWIAHRDLWLYRAIREADRESCKRFKGHGNAIAQVYNHIIMPLANERDKRTQVLWGIKDFEHHFGRRPEGMWLAETAVDDATLQVLAEAGIRFTILSPTQAARWRFIDCENSWHTVTNGNIPTGRAYLYRCRNGAEIYIFFYDTQLARGIAFGDLLSHSSHLIGAIKSSITRGSPRKDEPWLVNIATDGESYGHHFRFGDMALAAALEYFETDTQWELINYAAFLDRFPVIAEVEIIPNTAWSCAHGLGRWQDDCGCSLAHNPGWNQRWRRPLRDAMNMLRDRLAEYYEREMGKLAIDPWQVRDEYIEVLLQPGSGKEFYQKHATKDLTDGKRIRFYQLLEMQRCTQLMFTSCGWFFDEISGLETRLVLEYAARAMQLAEATGCEDVETDFLTILKDAQSNVSEYGDGAQVYLKCVKPEVIGKDLLLACFAMRCLGVFGMDSDRFYCYRLTPYEQSNLGIHPVPCLTGCYEVEDVRTGEREIFNYVALNFGGLDLRCWVRSAEMDYKIFLESLKHFVENQDTLEMLQVVNAYFGQNYYRLQEVFPDLRREIADEVARRQLAIHFDFQRYFYNRERQLMLSLKQWGIALSEGLLDVVKLVLGEQICDVVEIFVSSLSKDSEEFAYRVSKGRISSLLEEAKLWGVEVNVRRCLKLLKNAMVRTLERLLVEFSSDGVVELIHLLEITKQLGSRPHLWRLQTLWYELVKLVLEDREKQRIFTQEFMKEFEEFLNCHFIPTIGSKSQTNPS